MSDTFVDDFEKPLMNAFRIAATNVAGTGYKALAKLGIGAGKVIERLGQTMERLGLNDIGNKVERIGRNIEGISEAASVVPASVGLPMARTALKNLLMPDATTPMAQAELPKRAITPAKPSGPTPTG